MSNDFKVTKCAGDGTMGVEGVLFCNTFLLDYLLIMLPDFEDAFGSLIRGKPWLRGGFCV